MSHLVSTLVMFFKVFAYSLTFMNSKHSQLFRDYNFEFQFYNANGLF